MRIAAWLILVTAIAAGRFMHDDRLTASAAPLVCLALWFGAPRALRIAIALLGACLVIALLLGSAQLVVELLPESIAALVGWLFARSLTRERQPLIARAIAAMDGSAPLADATVANYARRLTWLWAIYQFALALFGVACIVAEYAGLAWLGLPEPAHFGTVMLPLAVAALFVGEFLLRPYLVAAAPRRSFGAFVRDLAKAWPKLIED
jgi:hypothetical protein